MRRLMIVGIALSSLVFVPVLPAQADAGDSIVFRPPYTRGYAIGFLSMDGRCSGTPAADPHNPGSGIFTDPEKGVVGVAEGMNVAGCGGQISQGYSGSFPIGSVPEALVGKPGEIVVTLQFSRVAARGIGRAQRWAADASFGIEGGSLRRNWTFASIACTGSTCSSWTMRRPKLVLRMRVASLPAHLDATYAAGAMLVRGTASFGAAYEARLRSVVVRGA